MPVAINREPTPNFAKRKLAEGRVVLGFGVNLLRGSAPGMIAAAAGFDWLFIDMEHGAMSVDDASRSATAALGFGVTPIVRCARDALFEGVRVMDNGAMGVIVPHIDTAEEARLVATTFRYPPLGSRSLASTLPQFGYAQADFATAIRTLNPETLIVVMIETPLAVKNADAIAAVEGIDVLLIGAADLSATMGLPGESGHPEVRAAFAAVSAACHKHGKFMGMGAVADRDVARAYIAMGSHMIMAGTDVAYLKAGAAAQADHFRAIEKMI